MGKWRITSADDIAISELYTNGLTTRQIAEGYGCDKGTILSSLRRSNTEIRDCHNRLNRHAVNEQYFDVIDTEEKAYWLGFLAADGTIYEGRGVSLSLHSKDAGHVARFVNAIESSAPVRVYERMSGYGKQSIARCDISSKALATSIVSHGITARKSLTLTFPTTIPTGLERHFIRGYVDGDGSWTTRLVVLGSREFLTSLQQRLMEHCNLRETKIRPAKRWTSTCVVEYGGAHQLKRLYEYLYQGATVFLTRKEEAAKNPPKQRR